MKQTAFILLFIAFLGLSFISGYYIGISISKPYSNQTIISFSPPKSDRPELLFFTMSFCPYRSQFNESLASLNTHFGNNLNITPHYLFEKITDLFSYCQQKYGEPSNCPSYVDSKYFSSISECNKTITSNLANCREEKLYLKSASGGLYTSPHGRSEVNQNVREICAWNEVGTDKSLWWKFVKLIDNNCTQKNIDSCWIQQSKIAGINSQKVAECFNQKAFTIIDNEINISDKYQIKGSPSILINESVFPPENAFSQDQHMSLRIGKKIINETKYRSPNSLKEVLCSAYSKPPKECQVIIEDKPDQTFSNGGCIN